MKQLFLFCVFTFSFASVLFSQEIKFPIVDGKITYSEVVNLSDSIKKDELFSRSKACFANIFKNSNKVIQNEDKDAGNITGKGSMHIYVKMLGMTTDAGYVDYTMKIDVKDGKFKYCITNFNHNLGGNLENGKPRGWVKKTWESLIAQVDEDSKNLANAIKREMSKPTAQSDNW